MNKLPRCPVRTIVDCVYVQEWIIVHIHDIFVCVCNCMLVPGKKIKVGEAAFSEAHPFSEK